MSQLLTEYGDQIELVLSNNDDMALGAVDAMKAAGIDQAEWAGDPWNRWNRRGPCGA